MPSQRFVLDGDADKYVHGRKSMKFIAKDVANGVQFGCPIICASPIGTGIPCAITWNPDREFFEIDFSVTVPPQDYSGFLYGEFMQGLETVTPTPNIFLASGKYLMNFPRLADPFTLDRWPLTLDLLEGDFEFTLPFDFIKGRPSGVCGVCKETTSTTETTIVVGETTATGFSDVDTTGFHSVIHQPLGWESNPYVVGYSWIEGLDVTADVCFLNGTLQMTLTLRHWADTHRRYEVYYTGGSGPPLVGSPLNQDGRRIFTPELRIAHLDPTLAFDPSDSAYVVPPSPSEDRGFRQYLEQTFIYSGTTTVLDYKGTSAPVETVLSLVSKTGYRQGFVSSPNVYHFEFDDFTPDTYIHSSHNSYENAWPVGSATASATRRLA